MDYFSLWFSWLGLLLNDTPPNETQQWLQLQGQRGFQHNFTSGKKYRRYCSNWNRYFESMMLRVNSVYQCPVSYITDRSWKEQHIKAPSSPSSVPWQKRLPSASKPHTAFAKMSGIVMFVQCMVLSAQLLRCRPHLRTQSMVPSLFA